MILEGLFTTTNLDGSVNIAPMGPIVDLEMKSLRLRPFQTSLTFANLARTGQGVFHVVDDVHLLARAAIGPVEPPPALTRVEASDPESFAGWFINDACRWYAVRVTSLNDSQARAEIDAAVVAQGHLRDHFGFNRARHAVLEAAILATRVAILPVSEILAEFDKLRVIVAKTGGEPEVAALDLLTTYVQSSLPPLNALDITG